VNAMENTPPGMNAQRDDSLCSCFDAASGCSWSSIILSSAGVGAVGLKKCAVSAAW